MTIFSSLRLCLIGVFFVLTVFTGSAQELKELAWEKYKIKFKVPSDFELIQSNSEGFSGSNSDCSLSIFPLTANELTYSEMENTLFEWVQYNEADKLTKPKYLEDLNGYWGCYLEGIKDELPVLAVLLVDPDFDEIGHLIWLSYADGYEDTALEIVRSFTPTENSKK